MTRTPSGIGEAYLRPASPSDREVVPMETPNMRITIEGIGDPAKVFSQVDAIREVLAAQGFNTYSVRVEESAE